MGLLTLIGTELATTVAVGIAGATFVWSNVKRKRTYTSILKRHSSYISEHTESHLPTKPKRPEGRDMYI